MTFWGEQLEEHSSWLDQSIREAVWRKHFQVFSHDLGTLLHNLKSGKNLESCTKPLLHRMLVYLVTNNAWGLVSFLLRTCMSEGVVIVSGKLTLPEASLTPENLRALAMSLTRQEQ